MEFSVVHVHGSTVKIAECEGKFGNIENDLSHQDDKFSRILKILEKVSISKQIQIHNNARSFEAALSC